MPSETAEMLAAASAGGALSSLRAELLALVRREGHERRPEPFQLSSGQWSYDYIDGKRAISGGKDLLLAAKCVDALASETGIDYEAVGGLTMGADPLSHGVALLTGKRWFAVRKEPKRHGKQKLIEGAELSQGERVLMVDDVVTTGQSILQALEAVKGVGAEVVLAVSLVDRGMRARERMKAQGVRYEPLLTFEDLGIDPVG